MVKHIIALVVFMTGLAVSAQVEQKDLQGKWRLVSYNDGSATINALKGTFELDAAYKSGLSANELKEEELDYKILAKQYMASTLEFKGAKVSGDLLAQTVGDETAQAPYTLEGDGSELVITAADGQTIAFAISLEGKNLHIDNYEDGIELVYQRH